MIDEARTLQMFGYTSETLLPKSDKHVIRICDGCGNDSEVGMVNSGKLCKSCGQKKRFSDKTARKDMASSQKKSYIENPDRALKASVTAKDRWAIPEVLAKISGENSTNWKGGISVGEYCPKFNNDIRCYIRDKYDNCDYISGIPDCICNNGHQLSVHHVDYNKQQGCGDHEWRLVPLSKRNHTMTNTNRPFWNMLFTYALQYDEVYYNTGDITLTLQS